MPSRLVPLINDQYYHVFNRSIEKKPIFTEKREYSRMLATANYYQYSSQPMKLSSLLKLSNIQRDELTKQMRQKYPKLITIIAFVLLPNHFHFLVKQKIENGISKFFKNISDSYTRYFNTKHERLGPIFQGQFKAVRIESDQQLLHLSRYIHLNPYTSFLVKTLDQLQNYPWSSLPQYLSKKEGFCEIKDIIDHFPSTNDYWKFISDQAEYQRKLEDIKHLIIE